VYRPSLAACALLTLVPVPASPFPPYRSTDAGTAGSGMVELRFGLLGIQRRSSSSERSTPLTRTNFGIGKHYEVITELEYSADEHNLAEGAKRGWRASLLAEFPLERVRPGVELFVKDTRFEDARVQAGVGVIKQFRHFQLRSGVHLGLSDNAPDVEANLWFAWNWSVSKN